MEDYRERIRKYIESIDFLIRDYCATGQLKKGLVKIFGKIVFFGKNDHNR